MFQHEGCLVPRLELLQAVWGVQVTVESRTVDSRIVRLGRKLRAIGTQVLMEEAGGRMVLRSSRSANKVDALFGNSAIVDTIVREIAF